MNTIIQENNFLKQVNEQLEKKNKNLLDLLQANNEFNKQNDDL
jgi:hypothetical protein